MYTYFDKTKEVLFVMQIVDDNDVVTEDVKSVMLHDDNTDNAGNVHPTALKVVDSTTYGFADSYRPTTEKTGNTAWSYDDGGSQNS